MKVLLKILKKNVRNSIVCFMSAILVAIMLFVFLGVKRISSWNNEYGRKGSVATRSCDSNVHVYIAVYWSDFDQLYSKQL